MHFRHTAQMLTAGLAPSTPSWRRASLITGLGLIGVLSLLASTIVPADVAAEAGIPELALRFLLLIQPTVLVVGAAILGDRLTRTTWLQAPFISGSRTVSVRSALIAALIGAVVVGVVLAAYTWVTTELAPLTLVSGTSLSLITAVLYGGITEEILIRWGLMGALVWLFVKISKRPTGERPSTLIIATAILVSSLAFALLHLPALLTLGDPTGVNIAAAMAANVIAGLVFGTVFAARGLEAAMGTHAGAHVVGFALTSLFIST
jgi:membrane protease YdiL (CAAX protease family)